MICNFKGSSIDAFAADKVLAPNVAQVNYTVDAGIDTLAEVICYITVNFDTYDNAKKVKNANNVIYVPVQNAASAKWYEATDDTVVCQVADELRKKAETTAPETSAPETPKNPGTGDAASIFVAVAVIALAGVTVVAKKKNR